MLLSLLALALTMDANTLGTKAHPPLRATDGGFTMDSVVRRLPLIVQSVLDANDFDQEVAASLAKLRDEIATGEPLAPLAGQALLARGVGVRRGRATPTPTPTST